MTRLKRHVQRLGDDPDGLVERVVRIAADVVNLAYRARLAAAKHQPVHHIVHVAEVHLIGAPCDPHHPLLADVSEQLDMVAVTRPLRRGQVHDQVVQQRAVITMPPRDRELIRHTIQSLFVEVRDRRHLRVRSFVRAGR